MRDLVVFSLAVIGGGAAGFFGAIQAAEQNPGSKIIILERSSKLLSKVRISGGGRCNVTHNCFEPTALSQHYPRGQKPLKSLFRKYQAADVVSWFESKGVKLKAEADGRMFPVTDNSETIINCFLKLTDHYKIKIETHADVKSIKPYADHFEIHYSNQIVKAKQVLIALGGHPQVHAYDLVKNLGHTIVKPIPSLFTFNDSQKEFKDLMGVSVPHGVVRIAATKFYQEGPILITHWGLSGPAVIKLSAWAAEHFYQNKYEATVLVSWIKETQEEIIRKFLLDYKSTNKNGKSIPTRYMNYRNAYGQDSANLLR